MVDHTSLTALLAMLLKVGVVLLIANEVRGFILAGSVDYGMYQMGGTPMAIWLGLSSLAGIALSVIVPVLIAKKLKLV